jgi:holin-like protein
LRQIEALRRAHFEAALSFNEEHRMVGWLTLLLGCQLLGEAISASTQVGIPGPVCGMAMLFFGLILYGRLPEGLNETADALLSNLSLLFVPAGVGVMLHFKLLAGDWLALSVALIASTALTIAITSLVMAYLAKKTGAAPNSEGQP